jgi:hypothetical protein
MMESAPKMPMLECKDPPPLASVSCQQEECTPVLPFMTAASLTGSEKSTPTTSHVCAHVGDLCDEHAFRLLALPSSRPRRLETQEEDEVEQPDAPQIPLEITRIYEEMNQLYEC